MEDSRYCLPALARSSLFPNMPFRKRENLNAPCLVERRMGGAAIMRPRAKGLAIQTGREEAVQPNLGEYWGDSLEGAVGPLVGYFLCRGVEGGGGPTIISILAA